MNTVLLIGIAGVYNYGCEAIVRGTAAAVFSIWPKARVVYASPRPDDDRPRLEDSDVRVVRRPFSRYSLRNISRKVASLAGVRWSPCLDSPALLRGVDAVVSIGGDIYTLREDQSFDAALPKFGDAALRRGVRYVLWGASVGPFRSNPKAERFFKKHLSRVSLIAAREAHAISYLASIGIRSNVHACADPAFFVAPEIAQSDGRRSHTLTIGINLSPLSLGFVGVAIGRGIATQAHAIEHLVERFDADVVLVPHVVCSFNEQDDDARYLRAVRNAVRADLRRRVELLDTNPGFIGAKKVLAQCDLVVAARMHCAINSAAARVPTIFLTYSQKARGMSQFVYGTQDWSLGVEEFASGPTLDNLIALALERRDAIREHLTSRMREVREVSHSPALRALKEIGT